MPIVNPIADWRLLIKGMGGSGAHGGKNRLTFNAPTDLWTRTSTGIISYDYDIAHLGGAGTGGPYWVNPIVVPYDPVHQTGGSFWELKEGPYPGYLVSAWSNTLGYGNITVTQDATFNRGPGATIAEFHHPNAHLAGASTNYNAPGEMHFTLLVDDPQIRVPVPKQTHYAIEFEVLLTTPFGSASADTITSAAHGLVAGDTITFKSLTGGAGLVADGATVYYVIASGLTANSFKVSLTAGGTAVNITTDITAGSYWKEVFAGYVWDFDQTDTECVFYGIDYLAALQYTYDERFITSATGVYLPDKPEPTGSKYNDQTITQIVTKQLDYHIAKANSIVGFCARGTIASMTERVTIYSTMQQGLAFIRGLLDSHRAGTGKETRLSVRKINGTYTFVVEDDPSVKRDDLALAYGTLVQGYRVIPFGTNWASRSNMLARDRLGQNLMYDANSSAVRQDVYGSIGAPPVMIESVDKNDMKRRNLQLAIDQSRFGRQISVGLKVGSYRPFEAFDITDEVPVIINHGAVDTPSWASDAFLGDTAGSPGTGTHASYWAILGVTWESFDDGHWMTGLTLYPKGGGQLLPAPSCPTSLAAIVFSQTDSPVYSAIDNNITITETNKTYMLITGASALNGDSPNCQYILLPATGGWTQIDDYTNDYLGGGPASDPMRVDYKQVTAAGTYNYHTTYTTFFGDSNLWHCATVALLTDATSPVQHVIQPNGYTATLPAAPTEGNILIAFISVKSITGPYTFGAIPGWTLLGQEYIHMTGPNSGRGQAMAVYAHCVGAGESATFGTYQNFWQGCTEISEWAVTGSTISTSLVETARVDLIVGNGSPPANNPGNAATYFDRTTGQLYTWSDDTETWTASGSPGITIKNWPLADVLAAGNDANALRIINLLDPVNAQDAATKAYVDASGPNASMVPYYIAPGSSFTIPINKQAVYAMTIDNEGTLIVDGYLLEVD